MFDQAGATFQTAKICGGAKAQVEGTPLPAAINIACFKNLAATGTRTILVDTVQPVMNETPAYGPRGEIFVNTYNMNGDPLGHDCASVACTGMDVWVMSNVGPWGMDPTHHTYPRLTQTVISNTKSYILPPAANEPGCPGCADTGDTRISGTPIYAHGYLWAAWGTGVANFSNQFVSGILWGQMRVQMTDQDSACTFAGDICPQASAAYQEQGYYYFFNGDVAAAFPALMTDGEGNLFMIHGYSSSTVGRSAVYTARRATFQNSRFHDGGRFLQTGVTSALVASGGRWGDYFATSYDGPGTGADHPWLCGQYAANLTATGLGIDWGTWCTKVNLTLSYG
jgi:hypothetical protein